MHRCKPGVGRRRLTEDDPLQRRPDEPVYVPHDEVLAQARPVEIGLGHAAGAGVQLRSGV